MEKFKPASQRLATSCWLPDTNRHDAWLTTCLLPPAGKSTAGQPRILAGVSRYSGAQDFDGCTSVSAMGTRYHPNAIS